VAQRIKEVMEPSKDDPGVVLDFHVSGAGAMPNAAETGYIDFVSCLSPYSLF
jgi:hypothetical protein